MFWLLRAPVLLLVLLTALGARGEASLTGPAAAEIYARLDSARPGLPIQSIAPAPVAGLYAVALDEGDDEGVWDEEESLLEDAEVGAPPIIH